VSESKSATPIESPSGVDLHPKPPNSVRVSKRAGALVFIIGAVILSLFAYGAYRRQKLQRAAVADFGSKGVAPATSAGAEIAKEIPSGSVPLSRTTTAPPPTPGNNLVPPDEVVWNRIIYPDGSSLDLNGMMGDDSHGNAGLRFDVDHHYKRLVGFAVLTSVFSAAFELSQSRGQSTLQYPSTGQVAGSAVGQEVSQLGTQITRRNLNTQPTIKIPVGYKFNVRVNRDILFDAPYAPLRAAH
jgi:type IV secretion system protein VirB10